MKSAQGVCTFDDITVMLAQDVRKTLRGPYWAWWLPHYIIGDGVELYEDGFRRLAEQALLETKTFFAGDPAAN